MSGIFTPRNVLIKNKIIITDVPEKLWETLHEYILYNLFLCTKVLASHFWLPNATVLNIEM